MVTVEVAEDIARKMLLLTVNMWLEAAAAAAVAAAAAAAQTRRCCGDAGFLLSFLLVSIAPSCDRMQLGHTQHIFISEQCSSRYPHFLSVLQHTVATRNR